MFAEKPITGAREGKLVTKDSFKKELDKLLKPLNSEQLCKCEVEGRECYCFSAEDLRRIEFRRKLDRLGIPYDEITSHSYLKGSVSFAASGSTQGPPIVSICLRAGWKLGGVWNTYLVLENAGDQFVGRVAAGLPLLSSLEFRVRPSARTSAHPPVRPSARRFASFEKRIWSFAA